jgi:predicted phosphodiesterase
MNGIFLSEYFNSRIGKKLIRIWGDCDSDLSKFRCIVIMIGNESLISGGRGRRSIWIKDIH